MAEVTVLGNFSIDRIDERPPSPGGCPVFAVMAFQALRRQGRVVARLAAEDRWLYDDLLGDAEELISTLTTGTTSAFGLRYVAGRRTLTVDAIGEPWSVAEVKAAAVDTEWVHVSPLLRSDFPPSVLASLSAAGHRISYDGQGLVRVPELGSLRLDDDFDRTLLRSVTVLKLNGEEADALGGESFDPATARRLGVPEILVTFGADGCDLYLEGEKTYIPARPITDIHTTGTGDAFMVSYLADRAEGVPPADAAHHASSVVADLLEKRRATESGLRP
ncbi:MAG TPA: PfkB family carbohydrate kinase [Solirubrobacterales bacterium]|nr:PfkB family carbohydrate kinase [Solirubrobacterales bacterium]